MLSYNQIVPDTNLDNLEEYFQPYREGIIGIDERINTATQKSIPLVYADWTASGRCYLPIEQKLQNDVMPLMANTHTESSYTGSFISNEYAKARRAIKKHVNANENDYLISCGSGMTGAVNKLQRILGFRVHERFRKRLVLSKEERPVVFVTHMEHHSNQTSWLETICEVVVVPPDDQGLVSVANFESAIKEHSDYPFKIASITACSNVTGIETPVHDIANLIHKYKGYCFVDYACSAPYVDIDMHVGDTSYLDAIFFSPHKFLGGPGSSGILVFGKHLYSNLVPDVSGGGTVDWTNPWGGHKYVDNIEMKEDGGTPAILQTIKVAYCIDLKNAMGVAKMKLRETELKNIMWDAFANTPKVQLLAKEHSKRKGIFSFYIDGMHHNDLAKQLNDQFGIQSRGGCSCAGTYGHYLLGIDRVHSKRITDMIDAGNESEKPGWVRISIHPTMTNKEAAFIASSILTLAR